MTADESDLDYTAATALAEDKTLVAAAESHPNVRASTSDVPNSQQKAANLRDVIPAAYLYGAASGLFQGTVDVADCQAYLHALLQEAGEPTDPIERMLIEQLAMAQHAIGRLHVRAATRDNLAEVIAYHSMLARLMSEFRKTSLARQSLQKAKAGAQFDSPGQPAHMSRNRAADGVSIPEEIAPVSATPSELRSNNDVKGREGSANCA